MTPEQIAVNFEDHEHEIKSLKHRMDKCEAKQNEITRLVNSVDRLAINMEYMAKEQKKQGEHIEKLEQAPAEDYKHYKRLIIGCVATGIIGTVLGTLLSLIIK